MVNPQYITDDKGKKISVVLSIKEYKKIMEEEYRKITVL